MKGKCWADHHFQQRDYIEWYLVHEMPARNIFEKSQVHLVTEVDFFLLVLQRQPAISIWGENQLAWEGTITKVCTYYAYNVLQFNPQTLLSIFTPDLDPLRAPLYCVQALVAYASINFGIIWYMQHRSIFQHNTVLLASIVVQLAENSLHSHL